jgi:hypothetical protein
MIESLWDSQFYPQFSLWFRDSKNMIRFLELSLLGIKKKLTGRNNLDINLS